MSVSLTTAGVPVAATANDIFFDTDLIDVDPADCTVNPAIRKSLVATVVHEDSFSKTLRFFIQSDQNRAPIPDGPLYTCRFAIDASALPGEIPLFIGSVFAFQPDGNDVEQVVGRDGSVVVTLVP